MNEKKHKKFPTGMRESSRDDGRGKKDESSSRLRVKEKVTYKTYKICIVRNNIF